MWKKLIIFLFIGMLCATFAYAGNESTFGVENDSYSAAGVEVYGGGSNAVSSIKKAGVANFNGDSRQTLEQPGYLKLWTYDPTASTQTAYYLWVSPSGLFKISSGASDANNYSTPNTANFDLEASGATVGQQ